MVVKNVIDELGKITSPTDWDPSGWNLTDLIARMIEVNGAPLFDIAVQVDDRNTSRYVLNLALPRQSGILPQFYSSLSKDLLHFVKREKRDQSLNRRFKRQFNFGDFPDHQELPEAAILEALELASFADGNKAGDVLPDADFAHNIQVYSVLADVLSFSNNFLFVNYYCTLTHHQQLSRDQKTSAAFRLMRDVGAFDRFPSQADFQREENAIRNIIGSIDLLQPTERERKLRQQSTKILNYFTVEELQQQFGFV